MKKPSRGLVIQGIDPGSPAVEMGLKIGDRIVAINGTPITDELDLRFYESDECIDLDVISAAEESIFFEIEKPCDETLGIHIEPMRCQACGNRCIFCFVDQNPPRYRHELAFRDEDYRFSFLHGQYVTLTHLSDRELDRILTQGLFPLYISIHSTDETVRKRLLGIRKSRPILPLLHALAAGGGRFHGQIVICPGFNDGDDLRRSISALKKLRPALLSLALIPVGLTDHRKGLPEISRGSAEWAAGIISLRDEMKPGDCPSWLGAADELYLRGGIPMPDSSEYGEFPQLENGVGLIRRFLDGAGELTGPDQRAGDVHSGKTVIITGEAAAPSIQAVVDGWTGGSERISVQPVKNRQFGKWINIAGLVTGQDIMETLGKQDHESTVIIPEIMVREKGDVFLDDTTPEMLRDFLGCSVVIVDPSPESLYKQLFPDPDTGEIQGTCFE